MLTFGSEDEYTTGSGAIEIAFGIHLHAVGSPGSFHIAGIEKDTTVGDGAVRLDISGHPHPLLPVGVGNVESGFIRREGDAVGAAEFRRQQLEITVGIEAIDAIEIEFFIG